jgi:hypothetical protein
MKSDLEQRLRAAAADEGMIVKVISGDHRAVAPVALLVEAADAISAPIPMILFCPRCGEQHIDKAEELTQKKMQEIESKPDWNLVPLSKHLWSNPPHKTHLCGCCGHLWRPCDRPTEGVREIKTKGSKDTDPSVRGIAHRALP